MAITKPSRGMLDTGISDSSDATAITIDSSENATFANNISLADSKKILVGSGSDLEIYFDGTNSFIKNDSGILNIRNNDIRFKTSGDETSLRAVANGAVELMHNNATKLSTAADGIDVTGHIDTATITTTGNSTIGGNLTVTGNFQVDGTTTTINSTALTVDDLNITLASGAGSSGAANGAGITVDGANATWNYVHSTTSWESNKDITLGDDKKLRLGASQDLNLYHNSSNSRTYMTGNDLELSVNSFRLFNLSGATGMISATASGVSLLQNTSVTGTLTTSGNVGIGGTAADPQGFGRALHVEGATNAAVYLRDTGNSNYGYIGFIGGSTNKMSLNSYQGTLALTTGAGVNAITIDTSQNATFSANLIVNGNTTLGNADTDTVTIPGPLAVDTDTLKVDVTNDRVGINKASPTEALDIVGNIGLYGELKLVTAIRHANSGSQVIDNDNNTYFILNDPEGSNRILLGDSGDATNVYRNTTHKFEAASGTERMRISSTGNVGIGGPIDSYYSGPEGKLDVQGTGYFGYQDYTTQGTQKALVLRGDPVSGSYSQSRFNFYTVPGTTSNGIAKIHIKSQYGTAAESSELFTFGSSGKLGIGTTSPASLLHVSGATARSTITSTGAGNNVGLILEADSADTTMESGGVYYVADNTADSSYLSLSGDNANYHLSVTHGGNVGIGTTSPKDKFHIYAGAGGDGQVFGGKSLSLTTSYQTGAQLAITLADHQGCYVKVFITGDWSSHSAMAFLGEYFIQNGAGGYAEPGLIIREIDNTSTVDSLSSQIVDSTDDTFQIQFKLNQSTGTTSASGQLQYQIMGQFDTIA